MDQHYLPCSIGFPLGNLTGYIFRIKRAQFLRNSLDETSDSINAGTASSAPAFFVIQLKRHRVAGMSGKAVLLQPFWIGEAIFNWQLVW
jgi:hypothetical protein